MKEDDKPEMIEFETINREINLLMKRLRGKGVCPCCVAQGLMYRGTYLYADVVGSEEAVAVCRDIVESIEHPDARMSETQHWSKGSRTLLLALLLVHSWYSQQCCGEQHCRPVPCEELIWRDEYIYFGPDQNQGRCTTDLARWSLSRLRFRSVQAQARQTFVSVRTKGDLMKEVYLGDGVLCVVRRLHVYAARASARTRGPLGRP